MRILVTGGAGFIGSNFLRRIVPRYPESDFINLDKLTYAANLMNLTEIEAAPNYRFIQADLANFDQTLDVFADLSPDWVIHFAAESHVDRSILSPAAFIQTNVMGTFHLLEACRRHWTSSEGKLFHHVSTDEVYGSLGETGRFTETTAYDPSSPYSASKAGSDLLVRAYHRTYGLPAKITNCSNNYGPYHFPEKLIPLTILDALERKPLPVYGDGRNVRDWLYVEDHCEAIWRVASEGRVGETYNIGGDCEKTNMEVVRSVCRVVAEETGADASETEALIAFVPDRPGHDQRYAIDASKIRRELGWRPTETFETGLRKTARWYLENREWTDHVRSGAYQSWIRTNYEDRETNAAPPEGDAA